MLPIGEFKISDRRLEPVAAKVLAGERLNAGDGLALYETHDLLALGWLGLPADHVVVIEDSRNGLLAASGAGLACVITVNDFTSDEDFSEAALVVSALGDPGGEQAVVIENRAGIPETGDWITLADLANALPH